MSQISFYHLPTICIATTDMVKVQKNKNNLYCFCPTLLLLKLICKSTQKTIQKGVIDKNGTGNG